MTLRKCLRYLRQWMRGGVIDRNPFLLRESSSDVYPSNQWSLWYLMNWAETRHGKIQIKKCHLRKLFALIVCIILLDLSLLSYFHVYRIVIFSYNASTVVNSFKIYNGYHNCSFCYLFKVNYQFWFFSICTQQFIIDQMKKSFLFTKKKDKGLRQSNKHIKKHAHFFIGV